MAQKNRAIEKLHADLMMAEQQIGEDQHKFIEAQREVDQMREAMQKSGTRSCTPSNHASAGD